MKVPEDATSEMFTHLRAGWSRQGKASTEALWGAAVSGDVEGTTKVVSVAFPVSRARVFGRTAGVSAHRRQLSD